MVTVRKNGTLLSFTYEELLAHHGGAMPGGVAQVALDQLHFLLHDGGLVAVHHTVEHCHIGTALHELAHRM